MGTLSLVSAALIAGNKISSKSSISQALPISRQTYNFSRPLPFKTIEQQKKEFIPEFKTVRVDSPFRYKSNDPSYANYIQGLREGGYDIQVIPATRRGRPIGSFRIFGSKQVQTNVFKPQLTSL